MDNLLLHLIFQEIRNEVEGRTLSSIYQPEEETFLFYFSDGKVRKLLVSARPGHPRILLTKGYFLEGKYEKSPFAALLKKSLEGLTLRMLSKEPEDRLLQLSFSSRSGEGKSDFMVMFELIGRSSNLILTDGEKKVLGFSRKLQSEFRAPVVGRPYQSPLRPAHSLFDVLRDPDLDERLSGSEERTLGFLKETMTGAPEAVLTEIARHAGRTGSLARVLNGFLDEGRKGRAAYYVYAPSPLKTIGEDLALDRSNFILSSIRLTGRGELFENEFETLNDAADRYFSILLRNERLAAKKGSLRKLLKKEGSRADGTLLKLGTDRKKFEDPERFRRYGELILAGMRSSEKNGESIEVEDYYGQPGSRIRIPIDPALSPAKNAELYFHKFRKAERGIRAIEERRASLQSRLRELQTLKGKLDACRDFDSLESVMEKMRAIGLAVGVKDRSKKSIISGDQLSGIRIYKSSDGLQILVGKSARDNMKLTFRVASPEDLWLHASGHGGAHVVVKIPPALKRMPDKSLSEAARLAAFYSSGKRESKVEVHYSRKKYVRKGRNLPAGTVLLKKFESILVKPEHPFPEE